MSSNKSSFEKVFENMSDSNELTPLRSLLVLNLEHLENSVFKTVSKRRKCPADAFWT